MEGNIYQGACMLGKWVTSAWSGCARESCLCNCTLKARCLGQRCSECPLAQTACTLSFLQVPILRPWHALLAAGFPVEAASAQCQQQLDFLPRPLTPSATTCPGRDHAQPLLSFVEAAETHCWLCFRTGATGTRCLLRLYLLLHGACAGCSSSSSTWKASATPCAAWWARG